MKTGRLGGLFSMWDARSLCPFNPVAILSRSMLGVNSQVRHGTPVPFKFRLILPMITTMPNLYFCQPHAQNQGMLRAVLTLDDCKYLVAPNSAVYVGEEFPAMADKRTQSADFAVLRVTAEEAEGDWRSGFYRFDADLMEINAVLLRLAR
jgi:hypothetical protein